MVVEKRKPVAKKPVSKHPSAAQTVIMGTLGSPAMFSLLLVLNAAMVGVLIDRVGGLKETEKEKMDVASRELRMLDNTLRDMQSVLISRGYAKPTDFVKPADIGTKP